MWWGLTIFCSIVPSTLQKTTDDKYAFFSAIIGIQTLIEQGLSFPTIHILAETEEESGSQHIVPYLDQVLKDIGTPPTAVFILDSGGVSN